MAATDAGGADALRAHALHPGHLDGLLALSEAAGWNQDADDWRHLLAAGRGRGLSRADGTVVASTVALPYGAADGTGRAFAWIGMVLVLPTCRGQGLASHLMREVLEWLATERLVPVLDATPAGYPVYRRQGFVDAWSLARHVREAGPSGPFAAPPAGLRIVPLDDTHWPQVQALDAPAFGGDRLALLRALARRAPALARVAVAGETVRGVVLGRPGRTAMQIGPLVAPQAEIGIALLDAALAAAPGRVFADAPDAQGAMRDALDARGFRLQRPFTRLVHPGDAPTADVQAPGDPATLRLIAGPELG
jgi:GNAT superfamily N-acetyltransferase